MQMKWLYKSNFYLEKFYLQAGVDNTLSKVLT